MISVHVVDNDSNEDLGTIEVTSRQELEQIAAVDWRPITLQDGEFSFRFHGFRWKRNGDEVHAVLWVSEG